MKVYVAHLIDEWDGQVETKTKVFSTIEKAREQKQKWIDLDKEFIDDVKDFDDNEFFDEPNYFYAYDSGNFDAKTIEIFETEVE